MNNRSVIYENDYYAIYETNGIVNLKGKKGGAAVLPVLQDKRLAFMKVYRRAVDEMSLEIPRGFGNVGESNRQTAVREMTEEIGGLGFKIESLGFMYPDSGLLDSRIEIFISLQTELEKADVVQHDPYEEVGPLLFLTYAEALQKAESGEIRDSFTLTALLRSRKYFEDN